MIVCTTETVAGREIAETLGIVKGSTVRARHLGSDFVAGLKNLVGGEIGSYSKLLIAAREEAVERMSAAAERMGADAVVGVRMTTSSVMQMASEVLVYGTAVKLR
ncbi:MAG: YbjQ family protein [Alphaproteobacteria bacterium]|nr:MAG: YbjQ family protein [Alphaproteobacteria bacterium]